MWKWLVLGLAVYVLYRLFANDFLKKKKENAEDQAAEVERKVAAGEMVKDPECGTYVCATATRSTVSAATTAATNSWNVSRKAAVSSRPATKRCVYPDPQSPSSYGLFLFAGSGPERGSAAGPLAWV